MHTVQGFMSNLIKKSWTDSNMELTKELVSNVSQVHQFTQVYSFKNQVKQVIKPKSVLFNFKTRAFTKNVADFFCQFQNSVQLNEIS